MHLAVSSAGFQLSFIEEKHQTKLESWRAAQQDKVPPSIVTILLFPPRIKTLDVWNSEELSKGFVGNIGN